MKMKNIDDIFRSFVKANNFETSPIFGKGMLYSGLGYEKMTKEQLMKTPDFAGFVDGVCGNSRKFTAHRMPKEDDSIEKTLGDSWIGGLVRTIRSRGTPYLNAAVDEANEIFGNLFPEKKYDRQYDVGNSMPRK